MDDYYISHIVFLGEYIKEAIAPLEYCHLYLPNVPSSLANNSVTDCPTPFFLVSFFFISLTVILLSWEGLARRDADFDSFTIDTLIFDMDNDIIRIPSLYKKGNNQ